MTKVNVVREKIAILKPTTLFSLFIYTANNTLRTSPASYEHTNDIKGNRAWSWCILLKHIVNKSLTFKFYHVLFS